MLIIKLATQEDRKGGWSFDYSQLQEIQGILEDGPGYRLQLEEIDAVLSLLYANNAIRPLKNIPNQSMQATGTSVVDKSDSPARA